MPNVNAPSGMSPVRNGDGSAWNQQANLYYIPTADATAYYIGDLVKSLAGADANGVARLTKAVAGDTCRGVIVGVLTDPNALATITIPATKTKDYYIWVVDDANVWFEMQGDNAGTLAATAIGKNANFTVAAPTGIVPFSATVLATATAATTSTLPLKILGLTQKEGQDFTANAKLLVRFNTHELGGIGTTGV